MGHDDGVHDGPATAAIDGQESGCRRGGIRREPPRLQTLRHRFGQIEQVRDLTRPDRDHRGASMKGVGSVDRDLDLSAASSHAGATIRLGHRVTGGGRRARELRGQRADAALGNAGPTDREHAHEEAGEGVGGRTGVIGQHAREEGLEHLGAERAAEPDAVPPFAQRAVRSGDHRLRPQQRGRDPASDGGGIPRRDQPAAQDGGQSGRLTQWMPELGDLVFTPHPHTDRKGTHPQSVDVDPAPDRGIRRIEHLEAAVEQKAVDLVGALPPAHPITRFENDDIVTGVRQPGRASQTGQARSDDDDLVSLHALHDKRPAEVGGLAWHDRAMQQPVVVEAIASAARASTIEGVRLIGVDGPSGAGKSTIARRVAEVLSSPIVEIDDFVSWVDFAGWWPRFDAQVLTPLPAGQDARYEVRDWRNDEFGDALAGWKTVAPHPFVVLEGVTCTRREIADRLAVRVWVDAPADVRLRRGIERDGESHRPLWERWMPEEAAFFDADGTRARADFVIDGTAGTPGSAK